MPNIVDTIVQELQESASPLYKAGVQRFFTEPFECYGVPKQQVKNIAKKYFKFLLHEPKEKIFILCQQLLDYKKHETFTVALCWAYFLRKKLEPSDFEIFQKWLSEYVTNWAACDDMSAGPLKAVLQKYPELISKTQPWARSKNRWMRRASAVVLIYCARAHSDLPIIFERARMLFADKDTIVQKGYGWLLKKTSMRYPREVFNFIQQNKKNMSPLAVRYAIEKLPNALQNEIRHG